MKKLIALAALAASTSAIPAQAAVLIDQGITYELDLLSITNGGFTGNFALAISGVNTASDTEGGRTGINAFAFKDPAVGTAISGTSSGFTFQQGGLNASGCNSSEANYFCFANTSAVFANPLPSAGTLLFSVTSDTIGSWANWETALKIDWTGSANNYSLVSKDIPLNTCPASGCPTPTPFIIDGVPEPSTWVMMFLGFGMIGATMRRARAASPRVRFA